MNSDFPDVLSIVCVCVCVPDIFSLQVMEKGYKRLTPDQPVGLRHAGYVVPGQPVIKVGSR